MRLPAVICDVFGRPHGGVRYHAVILRQNLVLNLLPKAHIPPSLSALASVSDGRLPPAIIATAAAKQAFAECIIKSQCLFRADNICPYGMVCVLFNTVGAAVCIRPLLLIFPCNTAYSDKNPQSPDRLSAL